MSLLMDALKKAEQEKKEAAQKLKESAPVEMEENAKSPDEPSVRPEQTDHGAVQSTTGERGAGRNLSLEPMELRHASPVPAGSDEQPAAAAVDEDNAGEEITLAMHTEPDQPAADPDATAVHEKTRELELESGDFTAAPDLDQTFHGVDMHGTLAPDIYEDTVQGEPFIPADEAASVFDETLPGVTAAQLTQDIGTRDQPTPVAAQTVFTATNSIARPAGGLRWVLISLAVLAVGSAGIFYYYTVTPVSRDVPSPLVARGVESVLTGEDLQRFATADIHSTLTVPQADTAAEQSMPDEGIRVLSDDLTGTEPVATVTGTSGPAPEIAAGDAVEPLPVPSAQSVQAQPVPDTDQRTAAAAALPPAIEVPPTLFRISRSHKPAAESLLITEAHAAYREGDIATAQMKYEQAFEQTPDNRDVLLGLAAVALRQGDTTRARTIYARLTRMNPLDNVARTALMSLQPGNNLAANISLIRYMLAATPDQPALHFNLGRLYAEQSRWPEAQQAFFDAYRLDAANPDYALNLAVSLDRLGQTRAALDFYRTAIDLSADTPAGFDPAAVTGRIQVLAARE